MDQHSEQELQGKDFWENHYGRAERIWSGKVNTTLAGILEELTPGTALDLGCGEGGDALWLASRGWQVTGVDISDTAIERAKAAAKEAGSLPGSVEFLARDLETWEDERAFDLVTLSFFHAPFDFQRTAIQRRATARVAPGGRIVVLSHGSHPSWSVGAGESHGNAPQGPPHLATVDSELEALGLPADGWEVLRAETVQRNITGPEGQPAVIDDVVVVAQCS